MKDTPLLMRGQMVRSTLDDLKNQTRRVCAHQHWSFSELLDVNKNGFLQKPDRNVSCPYGSVGDRLWVRETHRSNGENVIYRAGGEAGVVPIELSAGMMPEGEKWRPSIFMPRWASRLTLEIVAVRVERLQQISAAEAINEGIPRQKGSGMIEGETCYLMTTNSAYMRGNAGAIHAFRDLWNSINFQPTPIYEKDEATSKRRIVAYQSFPWSDADFDARIPGAREARLFRGKPLTVTSNPWVWVINFKRIAA